MSRKSHTECAVTACGTLENNGFSPLFPNAGLAAQLLPYLLTILVFLSSLNRISAVSNTLRLMANHQTFQTPTRVISPGTHSPRLATPMPQQKLNVLIVDDNTINLKLLEALVSKLGCLCDKVESGSACLESLSAMEYDLILLDITMPEMDGFETARRIRQLEASSAGRTRIYAVTASDFSNLRARCRECGMDGVLTKPIALDRLSAIIQEVAAATD